MKMKVLDAAKAYQKFQNQYPLTQRLLVCGKLLPVFSDGAFPPTVLWGGILHQIQPAINAPVR